MRNWSVDISEMKKDKEKYAIWRLEQMVNFGLEKEKISRYELNKYWDKINIDSSKKKYLSMLLGK